VSDFDPANDSVPFKDLLDIDKYALSRAAQVQAEILGTRNAQGVFEGGHFGSTNSTLWCPNCSCTARKTWGRFIWMC